MRRVVWAVMVAVLVTAHAPAAARPPARRTAVRIQRPTPARPLSVSGNRLVDDRGRVVQLRGVNRSSPETLCIARDRTSFFYGPTDAASVSALRTWGVNAVRIPVNEDCWLGRNGLPVSLTAADYRAQLTSYVRLLTAAGIYVIVDAHFAETTVAGVTTPSYGAAPMLDKAYGATLWRSIARTFMRDRAVLFDLYNEPYGITWECWRDGCGTYAGMRELVAAVRSTGATHPLILTGPSYGNEISRWLAYRPADPLGGLVAGVHVYPEAGCATKACLDERVLPVAAVAPVVVGEFGERGCSGSFLEALADWADPHGIGYLAFTWNVPAVPCAGYHLIAAFDGTPTPAGAVYRTHLRARRAATGR